MRIGDCFGSVDSIGHRVRGPERLLAHGDGGKSFTTPTASCIHNSTWTQAGAVPGCDGVPLTPAAAPAAPPPPAPVAAAPGDGDADGVTDDKIEKMRLNTPHRAVVDEVGCPKRLEKEVAINLDVTFVFGKADLEGDASKEIAKVSDFMHKYPSVKVTIEGYTDNQGAADLNKSLSQARANTVMAALVTDGIDAFLASPPSASEWSTPWPTTPPKPAAPKTAA